MNDEPEDGSPGAVPWTVWFVGGLSVFHLYLMSTNQTTYENFRYLYDQRANPYNRGVIENIKGIFFTTIPPSKNNFCGRVQQEHGLRPRPTNGFMSPNMGRAVGDIEMGRKPVAWDEPRMAAEIGDLGVGLSNLLEDKDGRFSARRALSNLQLEEAWKSKAPQR
ncbi:probable protein S-acyltransferase 7 [Miscanthus floridulus]|uniref:probable protein S-acyltransferase 7 n=1 Tax=Miscanthus floridulus TaxID=154761 RepID=UPI00345A03A3